ncbi:protein-L-isoaspartate O-methyltransferase family protein [Candidatus Raskinella chloraquaticus]|jgi:protein-L-isoaspartate(D-aspartate) O-methyltransferase|uniref:Protein-L-isoaspartate O-methyltransferase n=1 Tax=Candidatus Raskinella chloraquaticus TaxID=1951219 RepID=A0A1W9I0G0_9HYPH|nr:MAG: hypothetical protein A4S15_05585 [Proteobacteria bacterium SG_bin8]
MDFDLARETMVNSQIRTVDVTDSQVIAAFLKIRREAYIAPAWREIAYCDGELGVDEMNQSRVLPSPAAWARLVQLLAPTSDGKLLMIGCAGGYGAAILAELVHHVVAIEADRDVANTAKSALRANGVANVDVHHGAMAAGVPSDAPFASIIFEGAIDALPASISAQLAPGGRMVAVVGRGRTAKAHLYRRQEAVVSGQAMFDVAVPTLAGFETQPAFEFSA